jgi:hypothetical protein
VLEKDPSHLRAGDKQALRLAGLFLLLMLGLLPNAAGHGESSIHEEHVQDIHYADTVKRGDAAPVQATLVNVTNLTSVRLIYCRVQHYACGPALAMEPIWTGQYAATVPWTPRFFDGVTTVGVRLEMEFKDANRTHSPLRDSPYHPAELPAEADTYYFYGLEPEKASGPGLLVVVAIAIAVGVLRR